MILVWWVSARRRWLAECQVRGCRWKTAEPVRAVAESAAKVHAEIHAQPSLFCDDDSSLVTVVVER